MGIEDAVKATENQTKYEQARKLKNLSKCRQVNPYTQIYKSRRFARENQLNNKGAKSVCLTPALLNNVGQTDHTVF